MLSQKMVDALNQQINKEINSAYLYASMEAWFLKSSLDGFANWMKIQTQEELKHARKIYDFIIERNNSVKLLMIEQPQNEWKNLEDVFEQSLEHEKYITSEINNLYKIANEENDIATMVFLQWFVSEQIEEEDSIRKILDKIKMTECTGDAIFHLDKEFSNRQSQN